MADSPKTEYDDEIDLLDDELDDSIRLPHITPEKILVAIAALCCVVVIILAVACIPYYNAPEEDPEALLHSNRVEEEKIEATEELTEPEETTVPTIPPESNPYNKRDFQYNRNNYLLCTRQDSYPGVDVSSFQGEIDWQQVAASGIRFAMVRLGFRGYGAAGKLVTDDYAVKNLKGAKEAGLLVGAYFFSQAVSIEETDEEITYLLNILGDIQLDMPLVLDWEYVSDTARTANVDARTQTDCQLYFCETMRGMGFQPMVYFNWHQGSKLLYLHELEDFPFWLALYQDRMTYPYRVEMWQYTCTGKVPGISGDVDINVYMPDTRGQFG